MNNKKKILATFLIAAIVAVSGCTDNTDKSSNNLAKNSGIDVEDVVPGTAFLAEMKSTEKNQQGLIKKRPIPKMDDSLERQNLIKRYETLNDQNEVFHVYLMSHGKVVSYFTAQGKVSSVNSKLTQPQQLVPCQRDGTYGGNEECVVASPQLDGSYGTNGNGVFFYTTDGSYVEWNGEYVVSERPLSIQTPLSLEAEVNVSQ